MHHHHLLQQEDVVGQSCRVVEEEEAEDLPKMALEGEAAADHQKTA